MGEEGRSDAGLLTAPTRLPALPSPQWAMGLACIVFLLHNAHHLLYLLLSSMFFLSNRNKPSLENKQPKAIPKQQLQIQRPRHSVTHASPLPCGMSGAQDRQAWGTEDCRVPGAQCGDCKHWAFGQHAPLKRPQMQVVLERCHMKPLHGSF